MQEILKDSTSRTAMAVGDYAHPVTPEWCLLADLYDLTAMVHSDKAGRKKLKPYPRPGAKPHQNTTGATQDQIDEAMRRLGHHVPERLALGAAPTSQAIDAG